MLYSTFLLSEDDGTNSNYVHVRSN